MPLSLDTLGTAYPSATPLSTRAGSTGTRVTTKVTSIYDAGEAGGRKRYAFEAVSAGATVIKNGLAEVDG